MIKQIAVSEGIPYLDYRSNPYFQKAAYFKDASHMNDTGARAYTQSIAQTLKTLYLN